MCIDCNERLTRRAFLTSATATLAGVTLAADAAGQQPAIQNALDDTHIIQGAITFQSGADTIKGYLARPKRGGRFSPVVISHGNPGISEDIRNVAAQVAQAGFVGLAVDWGERAPMPAAQQDRDEWVRHVTSYTFVKLQMQDLQAGIDHLYAQPFIKRKGAAVIGFCGGGRLALLFSIQSKAIKAIVSFYGPVIYHMNQHKTDPVPDVLQVVKQIKVPVQGHYGLLDTVAPAADAKLFEKAMRAQKTPVEMYYYEAAGHRFYNHTVPQGSDPGFDYNAEAAGLARLRMVRFLTRRLA